MAGRYYTGAPLYPFGFGLSYANFTYSGLTITPSAVKPGSDDSFVVSGTVTHTGGMASDEVVQVYV
jgi:beta-glucosidase